MDQISDSAKLDQGFSATQEADSAPLPPPEIFYGEATLSLVGLQYYDGIVHNGELVNLVREPNNPYDRNAIRIDNLRGQKIGHVKRGQAAALAPVLDVPPDAGGVSVTVRVPWGNASFKYSMEAIMSMHGSARADYVSHVKSLLGKFKLKRGVMSGSNAVQKAQKIVLQRAAANAPATQEQLDKWFVEQTGKVKAWLSALPQDAKDKLEASLLPLATTLLPHQREAVAWMVAQEEKHTQKSADGHPFLPPLWERRVERGQNVFFNKATNSSSPVCPRYPRGGVLADDMGLGKTLSTLATIVARPPEGWHFEPGQCGLISNSDDGSAAKATLVLCPTSVVVNWIEQAKRHAPCLRVCNYTGANRTQDSSELANYDVVVTSYSTLVAEISESLNEDGRGSDPRVAADALASSSAAALPGGKRKRGADVLNISWHRLVLDEAHYIRNRSTKVMKLAAANPDCQRWALTGTVLQNGPDDVFAVLRFLGVQPFDDHSTFKSIIGRPIELGEPDGLARLRVVLGSTTMRRSNSILDSSLPPKRVDVIKVPVEGDSKSTYDALYTSAKAAVAALGDDRLLKSYSGVLECILRLRQACCDPALVPPERLATAREIVREHAAKTGSKKLSAGEAEKLLGRLRGVLTPASIDVENTSNSNSSTAVPSHDADMDQLHECCICLQDMVVGRFSILRTCSHAFCQECVGKMIGNRGTSTAQAKCPLCRQPYDAADVITQAALVDAAAKPAAPDESPPSTPDTGKLPPKSQALLQCIEALPATERVIVFSSFTSFLDRLAGTLKGAGIHYAKLVGSMTQAQRGEVCASFEAGRDAQMSDGSPPPRVLLASLRAAGQGLNLTAANHVFIMDPWWNSAVEEQAAARVHRIGQTRDVTISKLVLAGTIEERIIDLQQSKAALGKGALTNKLTEKELRKTRARQLRSLFD